MKKKLLSSMLAFVLCLGLIIPAFAKDLRYVTRQDILDSFTFYRNGTIDETKGDYLAADKAKLHDAGEDGYDEQAYRVISANDTFTITNTGSTAITASGKAGYDIGIRLHILPPVNGGADRHYSNAYLFYVWGTEGEFIYSEDELLALEAGIDLSLHLKAGESAVIPVSALLDAYGFGPDPSPMFMLYLDISYDGYDWDGYRDYTASIYDAMGVGVFYLLIDEAGKAQIDASLNKPPAGSASASDFVIKDGVLTEYKGPGGNVVIPDGVKFISMDAFGMNTSITSVVIPDSVTYIGEVTFAGCTNLRSVTIPNSVTYIGEGAFNGCASLRSVTIPGSVESMGRWAFAGCTSLADVVMMEGVLGIGDNAFAGCTSLARVTIPGSVAGIGYDAFAGTPWLEGWLKTQGDLAIINHILMKYQGGGGYVVIPNHVNFISSDAFEGCTGLTGVSIPSGVTSIEDGTFAGCADLRTVTIPANVTRIGGSAFAHCTGLTSVTVLSDSIDIDHFAFANCTSLTTVTMPVSATIGIGAFENCSRLTDVYYGGSPSQWKQQVFIIADGNEPLTRANIHYGSTDPITFSDVPADEWYAAPVQFAVGRGLIAGNGDGTFAPEDNLTRIQTFTILARLDGTEIAGDNWESDATNWVVSKGISYGSDPGNDITREELAVMLWRYRGEPDVDASVLGSYPDHAALDDWAETAMAWAVENGIVKGNDDGTLNPLGSATRAEAVTMIMRFCEKFDK